MVRFRSFSVWPLVSMGLLIILVAAALMIWWGDILQALLDPELPYAVYKPPPAPVYDRASSWALSPGPLRPGDPPVDVFFVHPTTFDGGRNWNGPIADRASLRLLDRVMLPNYAGPFEAIGRVFAPLYRQASLYTSLTLFDDAIEARAFAYGDVRAAFRVFETRLGQDRPFILVGVEQGGTLAGRLLRDEIETNPAMRRRLVAAYLIETTVPADEYIGEKPVVACARLDESGCLVAWTSASRLDFGRIRRIMTRSLVWNARGALVGLDGRQPLCVNPLVGAVSLSDIPPRFSQGAANATGLEWGVRPGFMARQVGAQCVDGVLRVTTPRSASLRPHGGWATRLRVAPYNLFWADLEADSRARLSAWAAGAPDSSLRR